MLTRRRFVQTTALTAGAMCLPASRLLAGEGHAHAIAEGAFDVTELRDGAVVLGGIADGGMVLVVPTPDGAVVVDAKFSYTAETLTRQIRQVTGQLPLLLVNTHHHGDHTGGNWLFRGMDVPIVSHLNAVPRIVDSLERYKSSATDAVARMKADVESDPSHLKLIERQAATVQTLDAKDWKPNVQVGDVWATSAGGNPLELFHYGPGHTDNDAVVRIKHLNIVHMGDLLFHNVHPFIDVSAGATTVGWQNSLTEALKLCDDETIVVPGHGAVTDRTGIEGMHRYFDQLREVVAAAIKDGKTRDEITVLTPEAFKDRGFERLRSRCLGTMYDELTAESTAVEVKPAESSSGRK